MEMKTETEVIHIQAKKSQRLPATHQKLGERHEADSSLHPSEGNYLVKTLISNFSTFKNNKAIHVYSLSHSFLEN